MYNMKIWPDLPKRWAIQIREAGMTKNQAKKMLSETEKTIKAADESQKSPPNDPSAPKLVSQILKKIDIL